VNKQAIFHQPYNNYAYPIGEDKLFIQLRAAKGDLDQILIFYDDRYADWENGSANNLVKMKKYTSDRLYDYFKAEIKLSTRRFKYFFLVDDGNAALYYSMYGFYTEKPHHLGHFQYTNICENDIYQTPDWVKNGVFYEVMLDRFYNGDQTNNPEDVTDWNKEPEVGSFYGGDLDGIIEKLDYLEELGVNFQINRTKIIRLN